MKICYEKVLINQEQKTDCKMFNDAEEKSALLETITLSEPSDMAYFVD